MSFTRPQIIRPPSEWKSYYLPLTSGCSNNTCTFCGYYRSKLAIRDVEEVKAEIDALSIYTKFGILTPQLEYINELWDGKRFFLQDGDALVYPFKKLKEILEYLNEKFPNLERIASYATPQDILRRSFEELKELKKLKLNILYIGLESGSDKILERVKKGVNSSQIIESTKKAKEAGITVSITVILGLGGVENSKEHAIETAKVLSAIDPEFCGALTLMLIPTTPIYNDYKAGKFFVISPLQSLEELKLIIENSNFSNCFFSSMHASNYQAIRGRLPQDKERLIKELDLVLKNNDTSCLRPEFMRGL